MPGKSIVSYGNLTMDTALYLPSITFPTLAANASGTNTATVRGVLPGDLLSWNMQAPPLHLVLDNAYVSAVDTVSFVWSSDSTGITGSTVALLLGISRADGANLGITSLPSALV